MKAYSCYYAGHYGVEFANKRMVLTFGTRRSFGIIARYKSAVIIQALCFRSGRPKGRTCEAFGITYFKS